MGKALPKGLWGNGGLTTPEPNDKIKNKNNLDNGHFERFSKDIFRGCFEISLDTKVSSEG